jgi:hypothetical protein
MGDRISHTKGLSQGDPLSPMLFLFIMEVLHALIQKADTWSLLNPIGVCAIPFRTSMYVDDLVLYLSPVDSD